jgi:metallophosphoesterase superfamily enzyme
MIVINDIHLDPHRTGGTTPLSFAMLVNYTHDCFEQLLDVVGEQPEGQRDLLVNGDLFDGFTVSNNVMSRTFEALNQRLGSGVIERLYLSRGNHDISKNSEKLSSFDLLGELLTAAHGIKVIVITDYEVVVTSAGPVWVLPHLPNQDLFDAAIEDICANPRPYLFVHANYDNGFAEEADHSLNVSKVQAEKLRSAGVKSLVFGHEHQPRQEANGVFVVGNQFPTSISDCLGNSEKRMLLVTPESMTTMATWEDKGSYTEVDWHKLGTVSPDVSFIRVKGEATAEQAADVLAAVSSLRKSHNAYVITNAVEVDGRSMDVSALEAVENVQRFDVITFLKDNLTAEQAAAVDAIVATRKETEDA